jgi:hypothetical protein
MDIEEQQNERDTIEVTLRMFGVPGHKSTRLCVPPKLKYAHREIKQYLNNSDIPTCIIYLNNKSIVGQLQDNAMMQLEEGDIFTVIPVIAGG